MRNSKKIAFISGAVFSAIAVSAVVYATSVSIISFNSGDPILASQVNANFSALNDAIKKKGYSAMLPTPQSVAEFATDTIDFSTVLNTDGNYNSSTKRYTATVDGFYQVFIAIKLNTGEANVNVRINDTTNVAYPMADTSYTKTSTTLIYLKATEFVEIKLNCDGVWVTGPCEINHLETRINLAKVAD